MASEVSYDRSAVTAPYKVTFYNEKGTQLTRGFDSPFLMRKFINKLNHSKKCELVSHTYVPNY